MVHGKNKSSGPRAISTKKASLGFAITLAVAGGIVIGSAGTYFLLKRQAATTQAVAPVPAATPPLQSFSTPSQPQYAPTAQPPGQAPPGKVWSAEHGHWHDLPGAQPSSVSIPATVTPAETTILPPVATPPEKKE